MSHGTGRRSGSDAIPSVSCSVGSANGSSVPKRPAPDPPVTSPISVAYSREEEMHRSIPFADDDRNEEEMDVSMTNVQKPAWSGQGARPKGSPSAMQNLSSDTSGGYHWRYKIEDSWNQLKFVVPLRADYIIDAAEYLDPCLMQHVFKAKISRPMFDARLIRIRHMDVIKPGLIKILKMDFNGITTENDLEKEMRVDLMKALQSNVVVEEELQNMQQKEGDLLEALEKSPLPSLVSGLVSVFKSFDKDKVILHIVGMQNDVSDVQEVINQLIKSVDKEEENVETNVSRRYDVDTVQGLCYLDFKGHLQRLHPDVEFCFSERNDSVVELKGLNKASVDKAADEMDKFTQDISMNKLQLPNGAKILLHHESNKAYAYIESKLNMQGIVAYVQVGEEVCVWCLGQKDAMTAAQIMKKCIVGKTASTCFNESDATREFFRLHSGKIMDFKIDETTADLYFTDDLEENLLELEAKAEKVVDVYRRNSTYAMVTMETLQKLNLKDRLNRKYPDVKYNTSVSTKDCAVIELEGRNKQHVDSAFDYLELFVKSIEIREIELHQEHVALLSHENRKTYDYVESQFQNAKIPVYLKITDGQVFVFFLNDSNTVTDVERVMRKCFCMKTTVKRYCDTPEMKTFLQSHDGSILYANDDKGQICLFFTADLEQGIDSMIDRESQVYRCNCNPLLEGFLKKYGTDIMKETEMKFQVNISFRDGQCFFTGNSDNGRKAKVSLIEKIPKGVLTMENNQAVMDYLSTDKGQNDVDEVAKQFKCCWKIQEQPSLDGDNDSDDSKFSGTEYHASWVFSEGARTVSVVEVDYKAVDMDVLVYPVSDTMFTPYATEMRVAGGDTFMTSCLGLVSTYTRKATMRDIKCLTDAKVGNLKCKAVDTMVISHREFCKKNGKEIEQYLSGDEFYQCISTVLSDANNRGWKSVGIPLPPSKLQTFSPKFSCKAAVRAVLDHFKITKSTCVEKVFLCCSESGSVETVLKATNKTIEAHFQTASPYLRRKLYSGAQDVFQIPDVKVKVEVESLFNVKVDCLVVAISPKLELRGGFVSNELLKLAGNQLQRSLTLQHPNDLKPGEIVIMNCGYLSGSDVKKVIFGYIPKWESVSDTKIIKMFVKDCLFAAESQECRSVAFPALGTGKPNYPQRDVAKAMFEGVEQFRMETMSGKLKRVTIAVYAKPDDIVLHAFSDEEMRRLKTKKERKSAKQRPSGFPVLKGKKSTGQKQSLQINVIEKQFLLDPLSSECVDVIFKVVPKGYKGMPKIKRSSCEPFTWTDLIESECTDNPQSLELTMKQILQICLKEKVSSLVLHSSHEFPFSEDQQVEIMVNSISKSSTENVYLRHITITTIDDNGFVSAEQKMLSMNPSMLASIMSSKIIWCKTVEDSKPQKKASIQLVGLTQRDVDEAKKEIEILASKQVTRARTVHTTKNTNDGTSDAEVSDDESDIFGDVSAEVNPDIVELQRKQTDKFEIWKNQIEKCFQTKLQEETDGRLIISGSLENIIKVEWYLDNVFPKLPGEKDSDSDMISNRDQSEMLPDLVDNYYAKSCFKFEVPITENERDSFYFFRNELDSITANLKSFQFKGNVMEIVCDRKYEVEVRGKLEELKKKINTEVQSDEIILENENEIKLSDKACDKARLQFKAGSVLTISEGNIIRIMALDYANVQTVKLAIQVSIGKLKTTARSNRDTKQVKSPLEPSGANSLKFEKQDCKLKSVLALTLPYNIKGLTVYVYVSSITDVIVEGIASAASERLGNTVGVAKVISMAAGKEFGNICKEEVQAFGKLKTAECRSTCAGDLPFKYVLHVVGPENTPDRNTNQEKLGQLTEAVLNCLILADNLGLKSIAIPCFSAGTSGFPIDVCAQQYFRALVQFKGKTLTPKLQEVHIVDIEKSKIERIQTMFKTLNSGGQSYNQSFKLSPISSVPSVNQPHVPIKNERLGRLRSKDAGQPSGHSLDVSVGVKNSLVFNIPSGKAQINIAEGDITRVFVDAIVCTENEHFSGKGAIVGQIWKMAGVSHKTSYNEEKGKPHAIASVTAIAIEDGQMMCKYVLYAVAPHWTRDYTTRPRDFSRDLRLTVLNILTKASDLRFRKVAVSLMGTSDDEQERPTPLATCCDAMVEAILHFFTSPPSGTEISVKEVMILGIDHTVFSTFKSEIEKQTLAIEDTRADGNRRTSSTGQALGPTWYDEGSRV